MSGPLLPFYPKGSWVGAKKTPPQRGWVQQKKGCKKKVAKKGQSPDGRLCLLQKQIKEA